APPRSRIPSLCYQAYWPPASTARLSPSLYSNAAKRKFPLRCSEDVYRKKRSRQPHHGDSNRRQLGHVHDFVAVPVVDLAVAMELKTIPGIGPGRGEAGERGVI